MPLIPVEEFLALHPKYADADDDERMFARIEHEREEREILEQRRQELLKRKQKLIAENKRRKDDLANLDQDLEKFIDVSPYIRHFVKSYADALFRQQNPSSNCSKRHPEMRSVFSSFYNPSPSVYSYETCTRDIWKCSRSIITAANYYLNDTNNPCSLYSSSSEISIEEIIATI